jgi:hypothetical protein
MSDIVERCRKNQCAENAGCNTNPFCSCADLEDAADTITQLRAKLAAAEADAGRYQWLIETSSYGITERQQGVLYLDRSVIAPNGICGLTDAIDAARGVE